MPPKPDEVSAENPSNREEAGNEPLYSSVRSPKSSGDEQEAEEKTRPTYESDGKRSVKEIYQHKASINFFSLSFPVSRTRSKQTGIPDESTNRKFINVIELVRRKKDEKKKDFGFDCRLTGPEE